MVDGKQIYYVTPDCEVICANTEDGGILWRYPMMKELKVVPYYCNICAAPGHGRPGLRDDR